MPSPPEEKARTVRIMAMLGTVPLILAVSPLVGYGLGYLLDRWLHTGMVLRLVFLALGFVAGVREMLRLLRRSRDEMDRL